MMHGHANVVDNLRRLPRKMLLLHGLDNVTEFVLHELCSKNCFNMNKAAYFIDNPDFNCLKGIAGVSHDEKHDIDNIWESPELFTQKMLESPFNQHVRSFTYDSHKKNGDLYEKAALSIANELGIKNYNFYSWDLKHNNHGFFICEKDEDAQNHHQEDVVVDGLCLLGFCPVH